MDRKLAPLHPGMHLKEEISHLGLKKIQTAKVLGISRQYLDRLLNGKASITAPIAAHIAIAFGSTPKIWMSLQVDYDLWHYTNEHREELELIRFIA